ncbi:hypothetical protein ABBQ32_002326 [Trebouxia sp. C0010 RCD-2024]
MKATCSRSVSKKTPLLTDKQLQAGEGWRRRGVGHHARSEGATGVGSLTRPPPLTSTSRPMQKVQDGGWVGQWEQWGQGRPRGTSPHQSD